MKENSAEKKPISIRKILLISIAFTMIVLILGVSFAWWSSFDHQKSTNIINSDCFNIEYTGENAIHLTKNYPITDEEAEKLVPYTFTITNTCDSWAHYQINLETIKQSEGTKVLPEKYIKANIKEVGLEKVAVKLDKEINTDLDTEVILKNEANNAFNLLSGTLKSNESKTYNLRLWMDESVTTENKDAENASYRGKIAINFDYQENPFAESGTLIAASGEAENSLFWAYKENITRVVFEPRIEEKAGFTQEFDLGIDNKKPVKGYLVPNAIDSSTYTLYIQSFGGVRANENSSFLFSRFTILENIEGLEFFDTSNVVNMNSMFANCTHITNLDLSSFNTSNVTNMTHMFARCNLLSQLDLYSFNTSKVRDMSGMFHSDYNLSQILINNFDTSNVTNMSYMFYNCAALTNLDLSNFYTSNVNNMEAMFMILDQDPNLALLDISNFNTNNVVDMDNMFNNQSNLVEIKYGTHFTNASLVQKYAMFGNCPANKPSWW